MSTTVQTHIVWNIDNLPNMVVFWAKLETEEFESPRDPLDRIFDHDNNQVTVIRNWNSREVAERWINFILTLDPVSATIVD
jgi:hypothetical protein